MLEGWRMRDAGYDVLRWVKCAAGAPGTVQVKRMRALLHSAPDSRSPLVAVCAPACPSCYIHI